MSLNLLAYTVPLIGVVKFVSAINPATYRKYEAAPESPHSEVVTAVAQRVLNAESGSGRYEERIRDLIQELPDSVGIKDVRAWIANRLKVAAIENEGNAVYSVGTEFDWGSLKGKFFIGIDPGIEGAMQEALAWSTAHEICHILEGDGAERILIKIIVSLATTILSTAVLGWTLLPSVCAAMGAIMVTHVIVSHRAENRADDFANKHCSPEERERAIALFEHKRASRPQEGVVKRTIRWVLYLSEDARIAKIRGTLGLVENSRIA